MKTGVGSEKISEKFSDWGGNLEFGIWYLNWHAKSRKGANVYMTCSGQVPSPSIPPALLPYQCQSQHAAIPYGRRATFEILKWNHSHFDYCNFESCKEASARAHVLQRSVTLSRYQVVS